MKTIIFLTLISSFAFGAGKIMDSDIKSEADILAAGGTKSQLINDTKIYVTGNSINKTLDDAITDGDIGGGSSPVPLTKGQLITHNGTTYVAANACGNGQIIEWDSTQANGFKCVSKPLELKYIQRLATTGAGTWTRSSTNVKKVVFYYCGAGGSGGGAVVTAAGQISTGNGGGAASVYKCTINNPSSTISVNIPGQTAGVSGASGSTGGQTTITGCSAALGGNGGQVGSATTTDQSPNSIVMTFNTDIEGPYDRGFSFFPTRFITENIGRGGSGEMAIGIIPELVYYMASGAGFSGSGSNAIAGSCSGGGGGMNLASQATARAGGQGGSGQIVSYEYE